MMLDDGVYSDYQLAYELKMTVETLRRTMTHKESLGWRSFFKRRAADMRAAG